MQVKRNEIEPGAVTAVSLRQGLFNPQHILTMAPNGPAQTATFRTYQKKSSVILWVNGSLFANSVGQIGMSLVVDSVTRNALTLYANETLSHKALIGLTEVIHDVAPGLHTVSFSVFAGTYDTNDWVDVTVMELPPAIGT